MNLKGQWSLLCWWQRWELIHYARSKEWRKYWMFKKKYLIMNIKKGEI